VICICYQRQLELLACFGNLSSNVGTDLVVPADLMPAVASLSSSEAKASAALSAAPSGGPAAAADSQAAAAAALSANPQLEAAAQLSALAGGSASMKSSLGVDMNSPSAGEACNEMFGMLPGLLATLGGLPLFLQPKVSELAKVGELVDKMKDQFGVDLQSPKWADALSDSLAGKLADAQKAADDAMKKALPDALPGAPAMPTALEALTAEQSASSTTDVLASTEATVQSGLGIDLTAPGAMDALGKKLSSMKNTVSGMPSAMDPLDMGKIMATMQMLSGIDAVRRTLGVDVLAPGAGGDLQELLDSLSSNLTSSPGATESLDKAASAAAGLSLSPNGSTSGSAAGSASLGASGSASGSAALDSSASSSMSIAADASAAALADSPLANPALAQMMAGMPGLPIPWLLLTSLSAQVKSTLGIQLIAHGPCE
jgi:hypothetical protein